MGISGISWKKERDPLKDAAKKASVRRENRRENENIPRQRLL